MTCTILRPDPQALFDQLTSMFSSTVLGGGKVIPESNEYYVVCNDYAMAEQYFAIADQLWREANPETACCDNLYKMAAQRGVFPKPPGNAEGYAKLTGTPGAAIPPSFEVQTNNGTYVSVGTVPLTIGNDGTTIVRIRALTPGSAMNAAGTATTGTLTTPAPGINSDVTICGGSFCGGSEAETCEQFRKRYLERLAYQPNATQAWLKAKLLEYPCATRVCVREGSCCKCSPVCSECGCLNCGNRMEFYVLFDGVFPCGIPPQNVVDDINKWLFGEPQGYGTGQVEIGVCGKIITPIPVMVDVSIDIEGCPTTTQKQMIEDQTRAMFARICPSIPLRGKQVELIIASILGVDINTAVTFTLVNPADQRLLEYSSCGDILPLCDVLPCINTIAFTGPTLANAPC